MTGDPPQSRIDTADNGAQPASAEQHRDAAAQDAQTDPQGDRTNMSARAYLALSQMIRDRELRGGDPLVEQRIARRLGLSRTPLREAMQRLEGEGLLIKTANRSYTVRKVELGEYLQSLRVREVLEAEAAALAAGRVPADILAEVREEVLALEKLQPYDTDAHWTCDDHVHGLIIDACGNAVMAEMLRELRTTTRLFEIATLADRLGPDSREHLAILDALAAGDSSAAHAAMAAHANSLFDFAVAVISVPQCRTPRSRAARD